MNHFQHPPPFPAIPSRLPLGHDPEGFCQKSVARKNGHRLPKDVVAGGFPSSVIIVIERGKVIVNQGVSVDHFQGAGKGKDSLAFSPTASWRHAQDRPDPLPSGEEAVADRPVKGGEKLLIPADPSSVETAYREPSPPIFSFLRGTFGGPPGPFLLVFVQKDILRLAGPVLVRLA